MSDDNLIEKRIAVLITCFNRKEKTLRCLESLFIQPDLKVLSFDVFLVDDGSTDGTSEAVKSNYPFIKIISGNGSLFWAGGMRLAWKTALESGSYDYFFLVNDDTTLYPTALSDLLKADAWALEKHGQSGLYSGSTIDPISGKHTYGGEQLKSHDDYAAVSLYPNGTYQTCQFLNANILLIPATVVSKIGIFSEVYIQSIADYDYSMRAFWAGLPVLLLPDYAGTCEYDHRKFEEGTIPPLKKRLQLLYGVKGYSYKEFLYFVKRNFPKSYRKTIFTLWFRTIFPRFWRLLKKV